MKKEFSKLLQFKTCLSCTFVFQYILLFELCSLNFFLKIILQIIIVLHPDHILKIRIGIINVDKNKILKIVCFFIKTFFFYFYYKFYTFSSELNNLIFIYVVLSMLIYELYEICFKIVTSKNCFLAFLISKIIFPNKEK